MIRILNGKQVNLVINLLNSKRFYLNALNYSKKNFTFCWNQNVVLEISKDIWYKEIWKEGNLWVGIFDGFYLISIQNINFYVYSPNISENVNELISLLNQEDNLKDLKEQ